MNVLPMGFSWSPFVAQGITLSMIYRFTANRNCLSEALKVLFARRDPPPQYCAGFGVGLWRRFFCRGGGGFSGCGGGFFGKFSGRFF